MSGIRDGGDTSNFFLPLFAGIDSKKNTAALTDFLPAIDPLAAIPDMVLWLDGSAPSTVYQIGGKVYKWTDKSGSRNHAVQVQPGLRPTYSTVGFAEGAMDVTT